MQIIKLDQIKAVLRNIDPLPAVEAGFAAYSQGKAVVPPVGELILEHPPGEVHIKYGYLVGDDYYVIKIASGFYENPKLNLPSGNGLNLLFAQKTGELIAILLDEGHLTDLRTALAGAIAAKYLAPSTVHRIGVVGSGTQARLQLIALKTITPCREVLAWGRSREKLAHYQDALQQEGFDIDVIRDTTELLQACDLIVTTTPATSPLLRWANVDHGLHITAVGSDTVGKQEIDADFLRRADLVAADSYSQCLERGECQHVQADRLVRGENFVELGQIISGTVRGRSNDDQLTVADLTGVAVQDMQIAKAVYQAVQAS